MVILGRRVGRITQHRVWSGKLGGQNSMHSMILGTVSHNLPIHVEVFLPSPV